MHISIICPVYNGEKYIEELHKNILEQDLEWSFDVKYILTESKDCSEEILKKLSASYTIIKKNEFSHSLSREKAVYSASGEIVVLITQDVIIKNNKWLDNLVKDIINNECDAAFSKQICNNKSIERYIRMKNYPDISRIASKDNINELGIMAYFYSDASSAIKKDVFIKLKGYDGKKLLTNEDMYIAYKLIENGYRIKYCAGSEVIHSHIYSYKSLFKRYFDQGVFLKQHEYISNSGDNKEAFELLFFILKMALKEKNIKVLFNLVPNFAVRFIANKLGKNYKKLSRKKILKYTDNMNYWE